MERRRALTIAATAAVTVTAGSLAVAANLGLLARAQAEPVGQLNAKNVVELLDPTQGASPRHGPALADPSTLDISSTPTVPGDPATAGPTVPVDDPTVTATRPTVADRSGGDADPVDPDEGPDDRGAEGHDRDATAEPVRSTTTSSTHPVDPDRPVPAEPSHPAQSTTSTTSTTAPPVSTTEPHREPEPTETHDDDDD